MQDWNVLHAGRCKYRTQKNRQKSPYRHHRTSLSGCVFSTKACIDNRKKKLLNSNISRRSRNMANFGPLTAESGLPVWGTQQILTGFASWLHYYSDVAHRRPTKLHDLWPSPGLVHYVYVFGGFCSLAEFCYAQNSLCVQVLRSPILAALLHGTPPAGVSQTLRRGTKNGITGTFEEGATYIWPGGHHVEHRPTF